MKNKLLFLVLSLLLFLSACSDSLVAIGYTLGSLHSDPDSYVHSCQIKIVEVDKDNNILIQYFHEDGKPNSTPFWVNKKMQENSGYCLSEMMEMSDLSELMVKENNITVWDYKGYKILQGRYIDVKKEGNWQSWYRTGQLRWDHNYVHNEQVGQQASWYKTGQQETEAFYEKHKGTETYWQEKGNGYDISEHRRESSYYDNETGVRVSVTKSFNKEGKLTFMKSYEGNLMTDWQTY